MLAPFRHALFWCRHVVMQQACAIFEGVGAHYESGVSLFQDVNLTLLPGEFYFLTGQSGVGKSTFLKMLYLEFTPTQGRLNLLGSEARGLSHIRKAELRQQMGIVFQDFKLLDHLTVLENVALALRIRGLHGEKSKAQAKELLSWVGITSFERYPSSLSGGEKQRVAIARAVISRPRLLVADEPTGNMDEETAIKIFYLFEELYKIGTTVVLATHSHDLITAFPHPTLLIQDGRVSLRDQQCGEIHPEHQDGGDAWAV